VRSKSYLELSLERHYKKYEVKSIKEIEELIGTVDESTGLKRAVMTGFLRHSGLRVINSCSKSQVHDKNKQMVITIL
jgi:hypothetical protein